jgi:hypothetical protein
MHEVKRVSRVTLAIDRLIGGEFLLVQTTEQFAHLLW